MLKRETEAKGALSSGSNDDDEDIASSPKGALSQSSPNKIVWRNKNLKSGMSQSYANHRDKNRPNATGFDANGRRYDERSGESTESEANQGSITQLSEQISTLNDRIDEFTSRIEELSSRLSLKKLSPSQQNMALHSESCNGSAPTSYFISSLSNGSLTGAILPNSSSSSQLVKDAPLMEEIGTRSST